jgi:hypothetical protein
VMYMRTDRERDEQVAIEEPDHKESRIRPRPGGVRHPHW